MDVSYFIEILTFLGILFSALGQCQRVRQTGSSRPLFENNQQHCANVDLRYRQPDGSCNHVKGYGRSHLPFKRYLNPHYDDRKGSPRSHSVLGKKYPLPSPRMVSTMLHPDRQETSKTTLMVMQMGQLIDHDITMSPTPADSVNGITIKCCDKAVSERHRQCFPIPVPQDDPVFSECMEFVRSDAAKDENGFQIVPREQLNDLTSFIDASSIYGHSLESMKKLRTYKGRGALLKTRKVRGRLRLPKDPKGTCTKTNHPLSYCQMAGDSRVNEQPGLSSLHLVFHLYHNHLVRCLTVLLLKKKAKFRNSKRNREAYIRRSSDKTKEKLFQEARKILSAVFQKITYCDWLPIVLGRGLIRKYDLGCETDSKYNPKVDPRIANVFLAVAFRFGHSLIPNQLMINYSMRNLQDLFNIPDPSLFHFESIIYGLCLANISRPFDRFVSNSVTSHLFQTSMKPLDLVSLNIQRGRDHGIPAYYYWRKLFKLPRFRTPEQFWNKKISKNLNSIYRNPRDIDLFTAGLMEKSVIGGIVGDTFGNILGKQFADLKYGDAYFFLSGERPQGFTKDQKSSILEVGIVNVMCHMSRMEMIQKNPFMESSVSNPLLPCSNVPDMDLTPWLDRF